MQDMYRPDSNTQPKNRLVQNEPSYYGLERTTHDRVPIDSIWNTLDYTLTFKSVYYLNIAAASVHTVSAIIIMAVFFSLNPNASIDQASTRDPYIASVCYSTNATRAAVDDDTPGSRFRPHSNSNSSSANTTGARPALWVDLEPVVSGKLYLAVIVITFFMLSAVCQGLQAVLKQSYNRRVTTNDVNFVRYVEYSFSASLMMVAIACTLSIFDVFTHVLIFACTFLCMLIGLVSDFLRVLEESLTKIAEATEAADLIIEPGTNTPGQCADSLNRLKWLVHYLSWFAIIVPYMFVFVVSYARTAAGSLRCLKDMPTVEIPIFVHFIVIFQLAAFMSFGVVQVLQFRQSERIAGEDSRLLSPSELRQHRETENERIGLDTEHKFIILSLTAKLVLGWLVASNVLFM
jgi:hypothetical protein